MSRFVIYYNAAYFALKTIADLPYTHVILAFIEPDPNDPSGTRVAPSGNLASVWDDVPLLQQAGKKVMISFGGGAFSSAAYEKLAGDVTSLAAQIAAIVAQYNLDGVDLDYEDTAALGSSGSYDGVTFATTLTEALYHQLPADKRVITHAPQPPYLAPSFENGPYLRILQQAGAYISWINLQFYNNPGFQDPAQITGLSGTPFVTSVTGLDQGVGGVKWPAEQIVVGKPVAPQDAGSGYLPVETLVSEVITPLVDHYGARFGGVMGWQYYNDAAGGGAWHTAIAKALPQATT